MKVVQVHKYWWPRDGASKYALQLTELLEKRGHEVVPFSMKQKETIANPYSRFFVPDMDIFAPQSLSLAKKISAAARMIYYREARRNIAKLLDKVQPDIVHLHNIYHHISPSILPEIKKCGIPIVMTLHDYKLICPNYTMFHHGRVHENDARGWYFSCAANACMKNSRTYSALGTLEMIIHHKLWRVYARHVDYFISPSTFLIDKCVEFGWPRKKFVHIPHPAIVPSTARQTQEEDYVLCSGRLSKEKGLHVLLDAAKATSNILYRIVGSGPLEQELRARIQNEHIPNVELIGFKTGQALQREIAQARVVAVPSIWYENYPLSILEAKAAGKLVIASNIGGIPEMLDKRFLFEPGDSKQLAQKISHWYTISSKERRAIGAHNRAQVEHLNNPNTHIDRIIALYKHLV